MRTNRSWQAIAIVGAWLALVAAAAANVATVAAAVVATVAVEDTVTAAVEEVKVTVAEAVVEVVVMATGGGVGAGVEVAAGFSSWPSVTSSWKTC